MKWSQLPKEYKDLIDNLSDEDRIEVHAERDSLMFRFAFSDTKQKYGFWFLCHNAKSIKDLPPIPK